MKDRQNRKNKWAAEILQEEDISLQEMAKTEAASKKAEGDSIQIEGFEFA